jgi:hypothetical protein
MVSVHLESLGGLIQCFFLGQNSLKNNNFNFEEIFSDNLTLFQWMKLLNDYKLWG